MKENDSFISIHRNNGYLKFETDYAPILKVTRIPSTMYLIPIIKISSTKTCPDN